MCKIKFCRDPRSEKLDLWKFKTALLNKGEPEEFFFFIQKFIMTLEVSGTIIFNTKIQYLRTLFSGEVLRPFDTLCAQVRSTAIAHLNQVILGLGTYFFL